MSNVHFNCVASHKVILMKSSKRSCGDPGAVLSCTHPYDKILCSSCWNPLRGPCLILHRSLWEDLVKIPLKSSKWSLHDLAHGSLCQDLVRILVKISLRSPWHCMILCRSLWGDLLEILVKSSRWRSCKYPLYRRSPLDELVNCSLISW